jgi:hypothetical protein
MTHQTFAQSLRSSSNVLSSLPPAYLNNQAIDIILSLCATWASKGYGRILVSLSRDKNDPSYYYDAITVINQLREPHLGLDVTIEADVNSFDVIVSWDDTKPLWTTSSVYMVRVSPTARIRSYLGRD